jgi:phenylalanyl-tRNA synthetase beta chain
MRVSLWPGLLQAVRENQRRQQSRVRLFEMGRRFAPRDGAETEVIAGVISGSALNDQWGEETRKADFFDVKADVEALLALSGAASSFEFKADHHPALHPGQTARVWREGVAVGWLGAIHPQHQKALDLTYPVFAFELDSSIALAARVPEFKEISKYPSIRRDVAVIVDEAVHVDIIRAVIREAAGNLLTELKVLSVYRGRQFEKGKKSIALGMQLQDTSRTLTDHDADAIVAQVVDSLDRQLNATIRDSR